MEDVPDGSQTGNVAVDTWVEVHPLTKSKAPRRRWAFNDLCRGNHRV